MSETSEKPIAWLSEGWTAPPMSSEAKREAGYLLGLLQQGQKLGMPQARPMPGIGPRCWELRIPDKRTTWRIVVHIHVRYVIVLHWFAKKTRTTPKSVITLCKERMRQLKSL